MTFLTDMIFPPRCALCDKVIISSEEHLCDECRKTLVYIKQPTCFKCGKEIDSSDDEYCYDCSRHQRSYVRGYPVFNYVPPISESLQMFKYSDRQEYAAFFGSEIVKRYGDTFRRIGVDVIIPVPVHKKKYLKRGYNQAGLIASEIGRRLGIMVVDDLLVRSEDTRPQKELNPDEREQNLLNAFSLNGRCAELGSLIGNIENMCTRGRLTLLLVDDIYTTGATVEGCTRTLKNMVKTVDKISEKTIVDVYYTSVAIGKV